MNEVITHFPDDGSPLPPIRMDACGYLKVCIENVDEIVEVCKRFGARGIQVHFRDKETGKIIEWDGK